MIFCYIIILFVYQKSVIDRIVKVSLMPAKIWYDLIVIILILGGIRIEK